MTTASAAASPPLAGSRRADVLALWAGILFSLALTGLIALLGERLASVPHLPDAGASWYYWQLPERTFAGRLSAWGLYALHQLILWGLIYHAQHHVKQYATGLHTVNVLALATNGLFALLHLAQTHLWYDGLAQDVSIWSSFGSVAFMLIWVLLMEQPRRGLFFGKPLAFSQEVIGFARRYHGYVFCWAITYTFWYHPAEATPGHLAGFLYTLLLMLQGSLFFTRMHLNKWWTLTLEVLVLVHGTTVALYQPPYTLWPMFAFGFGGIFILTQMHGLGLSRAVRGVLLGAYLAAAAAVYAPLGLGRLNEIIRIPFIDYLGVLLIAGGISFGLRVARRFKAPAPTSQAQAS
jgi:hypothetical protein